MVTVVKALWGGDRKFVVCQVSPNDLQTVHVQISCPEFSAHNRDYGLAFDVSEAGLSQAVRNRLHEKTAVVAKSLAGGGRHYLVMQVSPLLSHHIIFEMPPGEFNGASELRTVTLPDVYVHGTSAETLALLLQEASP